MDNRNALEAGTMLRHYRIDSVIGQGGFGITYAAYDTELRRKVAIKECYPKDFVSREGTTVVPRSSSEEIDFNWALGKFVDEATTLALFKNNGIVQVLQILKEENNTAYMVLEFVDGKPLNSWLKELPNKPSEQQLKKVIAPLLDALEVVHENKIAHRDIAPDNIFIRGDGDAVLLDFGAARQTITQQSRTMNLIVKDGYSAPEQYYAEGKQGPWTDIYAFAATLYRSISGRKPIDAMARLDAFNNGEEDPLEPLQKFAGDLYSKAFLSAVMKGMTPQTKLRPQSLSDWRVLLMATEVTDDDQTVVFSPGTYKPVKENEKADSKSSFGKSAAIFTVLIATIIGGGYWYNEQQIRKAEAIALQESNERLAAQKEAERQEAGAAVLREAEEREAQIRAEQAAEAKKRKQEQEKLQLAKVAQQAWETVSALDTRRGYEEYLAEHSISENAAKAKDALLALSSPWTHLIDDNGAAQRGQAVAVNEDFIAVAAQAHHQNNNGIQGVIYKYSWSGKLFWKQEFGDEQDEILEDLTILNDGSIIVVGHSSKGVSGLKNALIRSYNSDGSLNWEKVFARDTSLQFSAITRSSEGGLVIAGSKSDPQNDIEYGWLVKLNEFGDFLLEKRFGEGGKDRFSDVRSFENGNLAVIGNSQPTNETKSKFWLLKLDSSFNVIMDHTPSFGEMSSLEVSNDGTYYAVGNIKLSETAQLSLASQVTRDNKIQPIVSANKLDTKSSAIALSQSNEVFITGQTLQKNSGQNDGLITKYSADFKEVLWERVLGGSGQDVITDIAVLSDGTAVVVGSGEVRKNSGSDFWIMRLGPSGQYKLN